MLTATMSLWDEEESISRAELRLRCRALSRMSEAECLRLCRLALPVISPATECLPLCSGILQRSLCSCPHRRHRCAKDSAARRLCANGESSHNNWPLGERGKYKLSVHQQHLMCHHGDHLQSRQWEVHRGECCTHRHTHHTDLREAACQ